MVQGRKTGEPATGSDPRLIDARGERRLARVVRSNRRATGAQTAEKVNAGSDRKVSEHTVHLSLLRMGLRSRRPVRVPMLTRVHRQKRLQWAREHQNWTTEQWKKVARSDESRFLLHHVDGNEFEVLTRPPNSPDLNPMEHLWDVLDKQVRSTEAPPRNLQDLKDLLLTAWCQIPQQTFRGLVESKFLFSLVDIESKVFTEGIFVYLFFYHALNQKILSTAIKKSIFTMFLGIKCSYKSCYEMIYEQTPL